MTDPAQADQHPPPPVDAECPRCGAAALNARHCKLLCPQCGYVESCEDLFKSPAGPGRFPPPAAQAP